MLLGLLFLLERVVAMPRLSMQEAAGKTLCPFKYRKDVFETRVPRILHKVECLGKEDSLQQVQYHNSERQVNWTCTCTEIFTSVVVTYNHPTGTHSSEISYPVGCACVDITSQMMHRLYPDFVDG